MKLVLGSTCVLVMVSMILGLDTSQPSSDMSAGAGRHFEPQIAMLCPEKGDLANKLFHNKFLSSSGKWESDTDMKATCKKDKVEILEYCKKVYPERDITNIVESSHYVKINNWCKLGQKKCRGGSQQWVKPYRCLEGPFQSDALLVPEHCLFDHIHNQTKCWNFDQWNTTAGAACSDRAMKLRSFAMLLPCGIDVFSGVEFVCCPTKKARKERLSPEEKTLASAWPDQLKLDKLDDNLLDDDDFYEEDYDDEDLYDDEDDDDYYDDEEYYEDEYNDEDGKDSLGDIQVAIHFPEEESTTESTTTESTTTTTTPTTTTTERPTADPYFTHYDPRDEHAAFMQAERRFEERHRAKVSKVMKDWSDLEERYQDMRAEDQTEAEDFKKQMTERFQKTVQALEEESSAEKRQLLAMHQQRVISRINQRKKEAMQCYTNSLNKSPPNTHRVQKCLQKLLRSMHKDRHHTIQHYQHLLETNMEQADREKEITIEHLADIDRLVNESLQMLTRYPELNTKILPLMEDYLVALRSRDNTPAPLLNMDREHEEQMINNFRSEMESKIREKEREQEEEKMERMKEKKAEELAALEPRTEIQETEPTSESPAVKEEVRSGGGDIKVEVHATAVHHDQVVEPRMSHAMNHEISHSQATYSVRRVEMTENKNVYVTVAFAGVALMVALLMGVVVMRRRNNRYPHHQGFIEVDTAASPEEKHMANMQINGYENPTYKYFEASSA